MACSNGVETVQQFNFVHVFVGGRILSEFTSRCCLPVGSAAAIVPAPYQPRAILCPDGGALFASPAPLLCEKIWMVRLVC
jgi:hypothetical protein